MKIRRVYIEISNVCNLSCSFCSGTDRKKEFMGVEFFSNILEQVKGVTKHLYFHVIGEPLYHPQLEEFLEMCEPYGYKVHLITNGRLLSKVGPNILNKPALRQVIVSLQSLEIDCLKSDIDSVLLAVKEFSTSALEREKLWIAIRLLNNDSPIPMQSELNSRILESIKKTFPVPEHLKHSERKKSVNSLTSNLSLEFTTYFEWPNMDMPVQSDLGTCYGLWEQCAILVDGSVVPCCLDSNGVTNLGSVKEKPLTDILSNDRANQIRTGFKQGKIVEELCRRCTFRNRFIK